MPSITVDPNGYVTIRYSRVKRRRWGIEMQADRAIDVYTVPVGEMAAWMRHDKFSGSAFHRREALKFETDTGPEFDFDWDLVFENSSGEPIQVDYDVFER